jgi:hypothetical protein
MPVTRGPGRRPPGYRTRQRKHGGGGFVSERQRRYMWARVPRAAKKWAHNRDTNKSDWMGSSAGIGAHSGMSGSHGMGYTVQNRRPKGKGTIKSSTVPRATRKPTMKTPPKGAKHKASRPPKKKKSLTRRAIKKATGL